MLLPSTIFNRIAEVDFEAHEGSIMRLYSLSNNLFYGIE